MDSPYARSVDTLAMNADIKNNGQNPQASLEAYTNTHVKTIMLVALLIRAYVVSTLT